jgi:hypothetical protein
VIRLPVLLLSKNGGQPGIEQIHHQQPRRGEQDDPPIPARQQLVDEAADRHGETELHQPGDHGATEIDRKQHPMRPVVGEEAFQHGR